MLITGIARLCECVHAVLHAVVSSVHSFLNEYEAGDESAMGGRGGNLRLQLGVGLKSTMSTCMRCCRT